MTKDDDEIDNNNSSNMGHQAMASVNNTIPGPSSRYSIPHSAHSPAMPQAAVIPNSIKRRNIGKADHNKSMISNQH